MASRRDPHNFTLVTTGNLLPRSDDYCAGCGYFRVIHNRHRDDCTTITTKDEK